MTPRAICTGCLSYACRCPAPEPESEAPCPSPIDLFAEPADAPRQRHSATSTAAAEGVAPKLSQKRRDVLAWVCEHYGEGGVTDNVLIRDLAANGWSPNTPRARRVELVAGGWLEEAGVEEGCTLWRPTAKAWAWHRGEVAAA